jgi:surfactin synthase thioesterase subunit
VSADAAAARCLVPWSEPDEPTHVLLAVPHAAAGAAGFRSWGPALPGVAVYGVRFAGREARVAEAPATQMADVLAELTAAIEVLAPPVPLLLFGQCSGAIVAFELARRLRREGGAPVARLYVSGQVPARRLAAELRGAADDDVERRLRELGGVPEAIWDEPELIELILPAAAADFAVVDGYAYAEEEPLDCPVTALVGDADELVERDLVAGWSDETRAGFDCRLVAGGHLPDPVALAAAIRCDLEPPLR